MAAKPSELKAFLATLQSELAPLQAERAGIDLDTLQAQLDQAKVAHAAYAPPRAHTGIDRQERELSLAAGTAANALSNAQLRVRELERALQPLKAMLSAPARVVQALAAADTLAKSAVEAGKVVACKQETVHNLQALLADASATHELNHASAAQEVLASAKAGRSVKVAPADRGTVNLLESALTLATAELAESQAAHAVAVQAHADANQVLKGAEVDAARLTFELARRDFALNVVQFRKAVGRSYKPGEDLLQLVHGLERRADDAQTDGQLEG